ncbi:hypothetical protein JYU34_005399 [Plutella xylostella]|uniref:Uncharacterized protein n=1 Tax=Plutella xylostella TaxID=51655 RepID=A0ABQ7QWK2_PLUXY|nr:hypothetical protein JYU34_005399 [Plutella xylostella]
MYFLIIYFINTIYLLSAMVVAKGKFGSNSTVNKQTITIFNLDNPVYQKLNAEVSETFKLEDIITKVEDIYEDETTTSEISESDMKSYSSSKFNDDSPDNEILTEGRKSSWNGNYRISDEVDTEKPIFNNKKKMNKFKPFSLGPQLHNETVQIEKRQVDDDDHDDVSSLEKIEDADDSGEIEFVEPKEALLDSLGVPENKSPDQEVSIPEELSNNEDINFVEKSADIERNIADIQEQIPQENNEFKILYGNAVIEPTQPTYGFIPNAIEFNTAESIITSTEEKTETVRELKVTAATTIKETVNIINDAEDVGNIMNLKIAETSTRRNNWRKFNDSSWKPNRYLKKALLHKLNRNKTSTYKDVNVKPSASPAHPKKALFYAKVNKYTPSDDDDDDDDDDVKIRITKQDKHRHLDELYVEEDATTKNEMLNISGVPNIGQESTKKDSYIMKLISNVDRQRAVTRTTEAATVEDISEHHSALDKLIHLERKYEEAITSTTVKPPVTKSSERKSKYSKKGVIYKHYEYTTPETNDNTDLDTEVEVKPLQHPRPKDSKAGFFKSFPMKYTVSDDDEPTINQMKKTEDASDYFDYQQTVINPNRTITYDQDFSHGETTTRYIIPNRTKSDDHDFEHDETTTQFTRTFSKIIQNINHNETTQHPTVKPTRVRHKPSRPRHKYDTTTQMKWRSDFTKKKQDVLENSTIGNINTLKNHDFLRSKLNLPFYEREDQMIEEMFSTDRVVGRKRTKTVSVDAKRFSMPDNFANWKPEPKIANFVTKNKNYHSVSPENRRKLTSPIVVPTRTPIADNIVTVADRQTTTIHPKTIEPVVEITETRNLIIPTRTRTKKIFKKKHHYALPRIKIVTITPIKIPNRTKTLEYYIIPNVTATSSMYSKTAFSKDIAKSSQTNIMIPTRIRTKSVAKKFSQFLPSTIKTRKETGTTQHYTVPNRTKPMDDQHFNEDESTSQLTGTFSKVINKKSHLLTSRKPNKARTSLQYAIIPNRTEPIIVDYSNGRATKHTRTFNFSRIPKKSHLLTSVSRTKVRTSLQYAMVPNRADPIIYDQNYNSEGSALAEYTTGNLSEVTKKSLHQTSRSSNKAKSKISLTLLLPTITRTAKQHYSNNGEPTLHATKFSRIAKKLHRLTSRLPTKGKVSRKSSLQNKIFPPRTLTILDQHYITEKITTSTRKTSKMSKYTHGPFISTKQTTRGAKQQHKNLPTITRTKEISSTDYKSRYLSTRLYDFVTEATLLPKRKPYKTSHVMQYETIQTKSTIEEPPTYITLTLTEDYKTRDDVTTTEAFTEISEEYFNITYTIPTRTIGVIDQYTFILKPTKMSIVPQRTTGKLNNIKRNFGSKSKVRPNKNGLMKSKSHTNLDYNKTPGTIRTQNHFTKKFGLTRTSYQQALTRDRHKYKIGLTRPSEGQEIGPTRSTINAEYHYPTRTIDPQEYYTKTFGPTRLEPIRWTKKLYNGPTRTHMPEEESILHKIFKTTRTYYHADTKKLNDYLGYYTNIPRRKYKHKTDKHTFHDIPSKRSSSWTNMLAEHKTNDDSHDYSQREEKTEQQKPNSDKEEDSDSGEKNTNLDKYENSDTGAQNPHLDKGENSNRGEQNLNLDKGDNSDDTDTGETPNLNKEEQKSISPPIEQEEYKATAVQPEERANKFRLTRTTYKFKIVPTRTRQQHFRIMEGGHRPLNKNIQLNLDSSEERAFLFDNRNSILANSVKNEKKLKEIPVSFGKTRVMDDLESIEDVKFEFENVTEAPADYEIGRVTQIVSEATEEPDSYESLMKRINVLTPYPDAPALQSTKLGGFDDEETPRNSPKPKFKIKLKLDQTNKDKANEKEEIPDDVFPKYEELQAGPDEPPPQTDPAAPQPTEPQTTGSDTETTEESSTESNETSTEPVPSDPCEVADNFLKKDLQNKTILPVPFTRTGVAIGTKLLTFALVVLVLRQAT